MNAEFSELKMHGVFLNPYEKAYNRFKSSKYFTDYQWNKSLEDGSIDQYIDMLSKSNSIMLTDLNKKYNYSYGDANAQLNALYNEVYADRTVKSREIDEYDDKGNIVGKKTINISDYDYYADAIKYQNDVAMSNYFAERAREQKESMSGFEKFVAWVNSGVQNVAKGFASGVNAISELFGSAYEASIRNIVEGGDFAKDFGEAMSSDKYQVFKHVDAAVTRYEMEYGWRDPVTGEYINDVAAVLAGTLDTIGSMLPSSMIGMGAGVLAGTSSNLLKAATINTTVQQWASMGTFYAANEFGQSYERSYEYARDNNLDVSYAQLMLTDALATLAKAGISVGMNKVFGGTALERFMFGTKSKNISTGKVVSKWVQGVFKIAGDGLQEGTEEVLQDCVDALVHDMMGSDYAGLSTLSADELMLTFLTAGLTGVLGATTGILKTPKQSIVVDGEVKKLSKMSSYILALDFNNMQNNVNTLLETISNNGSIKQYDKALRNVYTSAKVIGSMFGQLGEEKVNNVMTAMTRISNAVNAGKFDKTNVLRESREMAAQILGNDFDKSNIIKASFDKLSADIRDAGLTDVAASISKGESVANLKGFTAAEKAEIDKLMKADKNIKKLVITKNGHDVVVTEDKSTIITPAEVLSKTDALLTFASGKKVIDDILHNSKFANIFPLIKDTYTEYFGQSATTLTDAQIVSALCVDSKFFEAVLFKSNVDAYEILTSIADMLDTSVDKSVADKLYIKALNSAKKSMHTALLEYLCYQQNADVNIVPKSLLSDEDIKHIRKIRYGNDLKSRVIGANNVSKTEIEFITKKINALPETLTYKGVILKNIFSDSFSARQSAWNILETSYFKVFSTQYDGKTYMPRNSIANHSFNAWLKSNDLTIQTLSTKQLTVAETKMCLEMYKDTSIPSIVGFRQYLFEQATHGAYTFKFDDSGKIGIFNIETNTQLGWANFIMSDIKEEIAHKELNDKSIVLTNRSNRKIITKMCNEKLSDADKAAISINDLVMDSSLLSTALQTEMRTNDYTTSIEDTFEFLRNKIKKITRGKVTLTVLANGTYALADITKMTKLLKPDVKFEDVIKSLKKDGFVAAVDIIDKKYVFDPRLEKVFFKLSSADTKSADYLPDTTGGKAVYGEDKILINRNMLTDPHMQYTLLHEYVHKLQDVNGQNCGFNPHHYSDLYQRDKLSTVDAKALIADVRKHVPDIFTTLDKQIELAKSVGLSKSKSTIVEELRLVSEFIYYCCGEINAFGLETDVGLLYYPAIVNNKSVTMPWGHTYNYDTAAAMNFQLKKVNDKYIRTDIGKYVGDEYDISNVTKYDNFLEIFNNPDYDDALELYNYLKTKTADDSTLLADNAYFELYMNNYPEWAKLYKERYDAFTSMSSSTAIGAYKSIEMNNTVNVDTAKQIKDNLLATLTSEDRITSLRLLHTQIAPTMSFAEFLNLDLPYVRVQQNDALYDTDFVSISVGSYGTASFAQILYEDLFSKGYNYAYVGTIKPSQLLAYIDPDTSEAIVKPTDLLGAERYLVDIRADGIYVLDNFTENLETIHSKERQIVDRESYFAADIKKLREVGGPRPPKYADVNAYEEVDESEYPKKQNSNYEYRRAFKSLKTGKVYFQYYGQKTIKRRQVSGKIAGNTNLAAYKDQKLSPEFQSFVVHATPDNSGKYYDKIQNGSLRAKEVIRDFRQGKITDPKVFKLVNDSFFKNEYIHNPAQLEKMIDDAAKYWAASKFLKQFGYDSEQIDVMSIETTESLLKLVARNSDVQTLLDKISYQYSVIGKHNRILDIDPAYLRMLFMRKFDNTLGSARAIGALARTMAASGYISAGVNDVSQIADSMNKSVVDGATVEETIADDKYDIETMLNASRNEKIQSILTAKLTEVYDKVTSKTNKDILYKKYLEWSTKVKNASDSAIDKLYTKYVLSDITGNSVALELEAKASTEEELINTVIAKSKADTKNVVRGIYHQITTIKRNLKTKDINRFLKDNVDIFNDDLTLKDNVIHNKDKAGRLVYKSREEIDAVKSRISKLSKDVQGQIYASTKAFNYAKKLEKEIAKLRKQQVKTLQEGSSKDNLKTIQIIEQDRSLTIDTSKEIPESLKPLLNYVLSKKADTNVQYLTDDSVQHTEVSLKNFVHDNSEYLASLTQVDVEDIVDFYLSSEIIPSTNDAARYTGIQIMTLSYILKSIQDGLYVFDATVIENIRNRLQTIVSNAGTQLDTWKTAMKMFKPAEQLVQAFYTQYGVNVTTDQLQRINNAYRLHDTNALLKVRQEVYEDMIKKNSKKYRKAAEKRMTDEEKALAQVGIYEKQVGKTAANTPIVERGRKMRNRVDGFFAKVWNIERAFMLSGPGTAIRNIVSNSMIGGVYYKDKRLLPGLNTIAGRVGNFIAEKFLPKKWQKEKQWKIVGTQVTSNVQQFIKLNLLDSGLMNMIGDSLNKYDMRKFKKHQSTSDIFAELITRKLAQDVFNNNHKFAAFFSKWLSDDKAVARAAVRYYGKLLTEDKTTITDNRGNILSSMNERTTELLVEAYMLAANDFMHKSNFMHKIEEVIKTKGGNALYFAWKQFFPFATSSVNWYVESLRYTPLGLIKSIINFAKLETEINRLTDARLKGETVVSSKFAQYIAIRNIGKGVIGTIGTLIGIILAITGAVKLDEDDDKYKVSVGDVSVDITDVFGTQGILMGMGITQGIRDDKTAWSIFKETANTLLDDSLYTSVLNMFKYGGDTPIDNITEYISYTIPNMFVPNFLKTLSSVCRKYDITYSKGFAGKLEKMIVNAIPFIDRDLPIVGRLFPIAYDPYTGEPSMKYTFSDYFIEAFNKLTPIKIKQYNMSATEELAISLGVHRGELTGRYTVDDEKITLTNNQVSAINQLYGKLNKKDLADFTSNRKKYKVENDKGQFVMLSYNQMTDKQKATIINRIMDNNSSLAKIYALTNSGKYKYYATDATYLELRKLGITKNIYRKTNMLSGFVKVK